MMRNVIVTLLFAIGLSLNATAEKQRPVMKEFMGINGHTIMFKPELYAPVCQYVRDYHPMDWDFGGKDINAKLNLPLTGKKIHGKYVNWDTLYGNWKKHGFTIDVSLMSGWLKKNGSMVDFEDAMYNYAKAFARHFGPTHGNGLIESIEVGNEATPYTVEEYQQLFRSTAKGLREGDPAIKILTATVMAGKPDKWAKPIQSLNTWAELYDVLNVHSYAMEKGWPTWERSYPEDESTPYTTLIQDMIDWRDKHAPHKPIWLTEFGFDACSDEARDKPRKKPYEKWITSTERQQAQWIVRSFMLFAKMDIQRAYLYWANDKDRAAFHGASGITRNYKPKEAYYAMQHLYATLGDYRYVRTVKQIKDDVYVYAFAHAEQPHREIWVAWSPTSGDGDKTIILGKTPTKPARISVMPTNNAGATNIAFEHKSKQLSFVIGESPRYIVFGP